MNTSKKKKAYSKKDLTKRSAIESTVEQPPVTKQQKKYRMKDLTQELAIEKARNTRLMEKLQQSQRLNEELLAVHTDRHPANEGPSADFEIPDEEATAQIERPILWDTTRRTVPPPIVEGPNPHGESVAVRSWEASGEGAEFVSDTENRSGKPRRAVPTHSNGDHGVHVDRNAAGGPVGSQPWETAGEGIGSDFERENRFSSTRRMAPNVEESRLYTSINQLSIASVNIPECKPAEDGEIHRHSFEAWKDLLSDSMVLAGIGDEFTKFTVFKVKAGARLLEIFKNTKSSCKDPDVESYPFANAMARLKSYFGSGSDIMLMRRKLALLSQNPNESDLSYITRVGSMARLCDFDATKEFEQIVATVAEHAVNREVRTVALKMLSRNQSFTDLIDKVREIEAIKLNEEFVRKKYQQPKSEVIATVSAASGRPVTHPTRYPQHRGHQNYGVRPMRGPIRAPRGRQHYAGSGPYPRPDRGPKCWRCNSIYHDANGCSHRDKTCNFCGRPGHIQRACRSRERDANSKRIVGDSLGRTPQKIAAIEETNNDSKSAEPVSVANEFS